jgi:glycine oxidase
LAVEPLSANETRRAEPFVSPDVQAALFFPNDWQVENRNLLDALRRYAELNGIDILENTHVESLTVEAGRVTGADTGTQHISAGKTVIATGAWTSLIKLGAKTMPVNITPVRGQMIAFQTAKRSFQRIIYSRDGYLVPRRDGRILAGSTSENAGFDRAVTDSAERALRAMACEIAPGLAGLEITDRWSGLRPFAADGLPVLGHLAGVDSLTVATAHYRNGILLAPLTATLVSESVTGAEKSSYFETFGPDRFRPRSIGTGS